MCTKLRPICTALKPRPFSFLLLNHCKIAWQHDKISTSYLTFKSQYVLVQQSGIQDGWHWLKDDRSEYHGTIVHGTMKGNQMVSAFDSRKHTPSGGKRLLLKDAKWHLSNFLVDQFVSVLLGKTSASALSRWGYGCWEIEHEKKENRIFSAGPASSVRTMGPNIV